jgi:stalled ribosome rescue protein Dom34
MDLNQARIFLVAPGKKSQEIIRRVEIKHHTSADPDNHKRTDRYFDDVVREIINADEILLMGPGQIKSQFNSFLARVYPYTLSAAVVATETVDHPTDNQILESSRKFFKSHDPRNALEDWAQVGPVS